MKKGFTLIELLATLAILSIIAVIGSYTILNVIENSKDQSRILMASKVASTMEAFTLNYELENGKPFKNQRLTITNGSVDGIDFSLNGTLPQSGLINIDSTGNVYVFLYDGKYCAYGTKDDIISVLGICNYSILDSAAPTFTFSTSTSIDKSTVNINVENVVSATDLCSNPYSFDDGTTWQSSNQYSTTNNFNKNICVQDIFGKSGCNAFAINKLTVSANGGILSNMSSTDLFWLKPADTQTISNPTRLGYTFSNWTVAGSGSSMSGTTFTMGTAASTLTANWTIKSYTLTVDANGGTFSGTTPQTIAYGSTATIANPTRTNYAFTGWTVSGTGSSISGTTFTMGTANATLTANWVQNVFTLTVNANSGTWSGTTPQSITSGALVTIANPTKTGYTFNGWTVSGTGSSISGTTFTMGSANTTLTANWIANNYTLTVNTNSGTWSGTTPQNVACGSTVTIANPTRTNYTFNGWTVSGTGSSISGTTFTMGTANATLTANWVLTVTTFAYTGGAQTFTSPADGWYKIELWGAQGGDSGSFTGGGGGYTSGKIFLSKDSQIYVYVGGKASTFNGGGTGGSYGNVGGGATDARLNSGSWNDASGLNSRIMVAAGGGGAGNRGEGYGDGNGGAGGGLNGAMGQYINITVSYGSYPGYGGTQLSGGGIYAYNNTSGCTIPASANGGFGYAGGTAYVGGGSGYYGGGGDAHAGGGGGSSFISGYAGVNAITSSSSTSPTYNTIHYSGKYFIDGKMQSGINTGNGSAKITFLSSSKPSVINTVLNNVRYIKDCINGSTANTGNHWIELQAIKDGNNLALGKTVTGTSSVSNPSYLVNGDVINYNNYSEIAGGSLQCVIVDLGSINNLDEIVVWHYWADGRTYNSNVSYVSTDNSNWVAAINRSEAESINGKRISAYSN